MDINFTTKLVTVTQGLPEQIKRIEELEAENQRLREAIQAISDGIYIAKHYADKAMREKE